jgi:hypothetical protein
MGHRAGALEEVLLAGHGRRGGQPGVAAQRGPRLGGSPVDVGELAVCLAQVAGEAEVAVRAHVGHERRPAQLHLRAYVVEHDLLRDAVEHQGAARRQVREPAGDLVDEPLARRPGQRPVAQVERSGTRGAARR